GEFEEVQQIRGFGRSLDKESGAARERGKPLVQFFINGGVKRMARTEQDGVNVLILLQVVLVKGNLAVGRFRLSKMTGSLEPLGAEVGQDVFHAPKAVSTRLHLETNLLACLDELIFDIPRHEATLFGLDIGFLEAGEIHVCAGKRDARGLLI